ncbi:DUF4266 domain-containing protein [Seonamhaeicola sp.]|uniref:DUF4266 domain-containing protein n=1 Tax=Seonamhaeicola sp. TaxID=1912245 RepID=UPI0026298652|nr:DUF4266 domain-containing protein [Seonamhaeicola sp.]
MKKLITGLLVITSLNLTSCLAVKEYEKVNLNDPDMKLSSMSVERFETNFQVYREAASGANGGKTGGGCGCN